MTCSLCGGSVSTCASCHGTCVSPVCHTCRDSASVVHTSGQKLTLTLLPPVVLV